MAIGYVRDFWNLIRELDPSDIAEAADRLPRIEIDTDPDLAVDLTRALGGGASRAATVLQAVANGVTGPIDLLIADERPLPPRRSGPRIVLRISPGSPVRVERPDPDRTILTVPSSSELDLRAALVPAVIDRLPNHAIALGRHLPPFRHAAAVSIVKSTSIGNAEFAALSNIPQLVPVLGNLLGSAADFLVLTKNQVLMLIKLATIFDRQSRNNVGILKEILPVVGAGLVWRTIARELAGLLPFYAGAIPKVIIAYVGTYVAGMSALYYYEEGRRPPSEVIRSLQLQAVERARGLRALLPGGRTEPPSANGRADL